MSIPSLQPVCHRLEKKHRLGGGAQIFLQLELIPVGGKPIDPSTIGILDDGWNKKLKGDNGDHRSHEFVTHVRVYHCKYGSKDEAEIESRSDHHSAEWTDSDTSQHVAEEPPKLLECGNKPKTGDPIQNELSTRTTDSVTKSPSNEATTQDASIDPGKEKTKIRQTSEGKKTQTRRSMDADKDSAPSGPSADITPRRRRRLVEEPRAEQTCHSRRRSGSLSSSLREEGSSRSRPGDSSSHRRSLSISARYYAQRSDNNKSLPATADRRNQKEEEESHPPKSHDSVITSPSNTGTRDDLSMDLEKEKVKMRRTGDRKKTIPDRPTDSHRQRSRAL